MATDSGFSQTEIRKFSEAGRVIAAAVGASVEQWARAESGVILKTWAGRTKVASEKAVTTRAILREYRDARQIVYGLPKGATPPGTASINLGLRQGNAGRVWYRTRKNKKFQMTYTAGFRQPHWRIRDADWPQVDRMVNIFRHQVRLGIAAAKKSAGLARQSVIQIADDLGIRIEAVKGGGTLSASGIAKARSAIASNGQRYRNGFGREYQSAQQFFIELVNRYPKIGVIGMDTVLMGVIRGRLQFFRRNLEHGTFLSAKRAARAYPYLQVLKDAA